MEREITKTMWSAGPHRHILIKTRTGSLQILDRIYKFHELRKLEYTEYFNEQQKNAKLSTFMVVQRN